MFKKLFIAAALAAAAAAAAAATQPFPRDGTAPDAGAAAVVVTAHKGNAAPSCAGGTNVTIGTNTICGLISTANTGVYAYEGIQYASVPQNAGGPERFQPSTQSTVTQSVNATQFQAICPQYPAPSGATMSDDCLYLNIWTPAGAAKNPGTLPVMVFIHGGAFLSGSGSSALYDGSALASQGVIVVTLNYRLGALGFLVANSDGVAANGNLGLLDQTNALKWVNQYIGQFGGNKNKVTIVGESAGAMSVGLHAFDMPGDANLFQAAIMESNPMAIQYQSAANTQTFGNAFIAYLCQKAKPAGGCTGSAWYAPDQIDAATFAHDQTSFLGQYTPSSGESPISLPFQPITSSDVIGQPSAGFAGSITPMPVVFGVNQNEGPLFVGLFNFLKNSNSTATPTQAQYNSALSAYFDTATIARIANNKNYKWVDGSGTYYSKGGAQLARILTNYVFLCANTQTANSVRSKYDYVYAYMFAQPPFFDSYVTQTEATFGVYPDSHACWPANGNTCHGNELPYVFNNLSYPQSLYPAKYIPGATDQPLATKMNAAWVGFVKDPKKPGAGWMRFRISSKREEGTAWLWKGTDKIQHSLNLDNRANCTSFWWKQDQQKSDAQ